MEPKKNNPVYSTNDNSQVDISKHEWKFLPKDAYHITREKALKVDLLPENTMHILKEALLTIAQFVEILYLKAMRGGNPVLQRTTSFYPITKRKYYLYTR